MKSIFNFFSLIALIISIIGGKIIGSLRWISAHDGYIPAHAVQAGQKQHQKLYFARISNGQGDHIGYIGRGDHQATIAHDFGYDKYQHYQVLVGSIKNIVWVDSSSNNFMKNGIEGGRRQNGDIIYLGRAEFSNGDGKSSSLLPGQYNKKWPGLWSSNGNSAFFSVKFQLLAFSKEEYNYQYQYYQSEFQKDKLSELAKVLNDSDKHQSSNKQWMILGISFLIIGVFLTIAVIVLACRYRKISDVKVPLSDNEGKEHGQAVVIQEDMAK